MSPNILKTGIDDKRLKGNFLMLPVLIYEIIVIIFSVKI